MADAGPGLSRRTPRASPCASAAAAPSTATPASQQPWMAVTSAAAGRAEDGDVVAGRDAPGLERGADGAGLVVELRPGDARSPSRPATKDRRSARRRSGRLDAAGDGRRRSTVRDPGTCRHATRASGSIELASRVDARATRSQVATVGSSPWPHRRRRRRRADRHGRRRRPRTATPPALAERDRAALAGPLGGARAPSTRPTRPARWPRLRRRSPAGPKLFVLDMFPYPSRRRAARRPPAGLHRHRRLRPLPADDRPQRAARDGLRRVRPARRAVRRADRPAPARSPPRRTSPTCRRQLRRLGLGHDDRGAASPRPTRATTAGRSGSSCRSSTPGTTPRPDRARPIAELVAEFEAGDARRRPTAAPWAELDRASSSADVVDDHRLAYIAEAPVNWCPGLGTVLANEEVTADGRSERGNFPVFQRALTQWMMRITAYADRLLDDLDLLDWPESIKLMQRNWIGRCTGALGRLPGRRARRRRSRCSPPGPTRCSARPTWCWRPSTRWSTR